MIKTVPVRFKGRRRGISVIEREIKLVGSRGEKVVSAIFDSGATYSCVNENIAEKLAHVEPLPSPLVLGTAKENETVIAEKVIRLDFYIGEYRFTDEFLVIENLSEECVIGALTMQKWRFKLDFEKEDIIIDPRVTKLRLL